MRGRNARKGRTKHRSTQSNRTPPRGKSLEVASGSEHVMKGPRNILLDGRPNGYGQIFETGHRSKIRDVDVLRSDDLKNKVANAKGAYIQLKVPRRLQVNFGIEGIDSPTWSTYDPILAAEPRETAVFSPALYSARTAAAYQKRIAGVERALAKITCPVTRLIGS